MQRTIVWHEANQGLFERQLGIPSGIGVGHSCRPKGREWAGWGGFGTPSGKQTSRQIGDVTCVQKARERIEPWGQRPRAHS